MIPRVVSALMLTSAVSFAGRAQQDVRPFISPMFSDNMVLQREMRDPVWGWAAPGTKVTVSMADQTASATAGSNGRWLVKIGPFPVGGPYTMTVAGPQSTTFSNVMVGDVWICSGQVKNMEFGVGNLKNPDEEIAAADHPNLRLYMEPKTISADPLGVTSGNWLTCTPDNLKKDGGWGGFSAVAYFYGRKLQEDLKVPIGLIHTSWGGTPAEAWTSEKDLGDKVPAYRGNIAQLEAIREAKKHPAPVGTDPFTAWYQKNDPGSATDPGWASTLVDDSPAWKSMDLPKFFQDAGFPELVNQESVVWFRKEVDLPEDVAGKGVTLHFVATTDNDAAWVNGVKVGATDGYNVPRAYKVAANVAETVGKNLIAIRVTDDQAPGGIWGDPAGLNLEVAGGSPISLVGSWKVKLGTAITSKNPLPATFQDNPNFPTVLYNGMIQPIIPFGVKGAIWYQGESNAGKAYEYRTLLPTMISSWRRNWGQGDFPFLIVQLAGFQHAPKDPGDDAWAELREAQWMTAKNVRNAGIATAVDIGEENDIHPKNKQEVGRRLALVAEKQVYRMPVTSSGPVYKSMSIEDTVLFG